MKKILKQLIKEEISKFLSLLTEGRFEEVTLKFPEYKDEILWFKNNGLKPKYIEWLVRQLKILGIKEENKSKLQDYLETLNGFDKLIEKNQLQNKDITKYTYQQVYDTVQQKLKTLETKEQKNISGKDYETVFSDNEWLITQPNTEEASCRLGANTKWCISSTESANHFEDYASRGAKFIFIFDRKNNKKWAVAYGQGVNFIEIFDELDQKISHVALNKILPKHIVNIVNSKLGFDALTNTFAIRSTFGKIIYENENVSSTREALEQAIANKINLEDVNLEGEELTGIDLRGMNLERANLKRTKLSGAILRRTILEDANLEDATLVDAKLSNSYLSRANLTNASLYRANLESSDLKQTNLRQAILDDANLTNADLTEAQLESASFDRANMTGAIVSLEEQVFLEEYRSSIINYKYIKWK